MIADAQKYVNDVFWYMSQNTPDTMTRIMRNKTQVTHANCIVTSEWFQSYAAVLQDMIPKDITTGLPVQNAWKC
jgi:hypothetical protein